MLLHFLCVDHHVEAFVPQVMQSASDSLQSTLDNEDQNDPMVEAKNRGKEAALKFKMGGCCKICETRFYRDLAFLEVSESYKLEAVKRFHAWHAYGRPVGHNSNPILHEEKIIAHAPRGKALIDVHNAFLEVAEEVKNEKAMKEKKDDQGEGKNELGNSGNAFVFLQENNHNQLLVKKGQSSSNMEDSNSLNSRKGGGSSKSQPSGGGSKGGSKPSGGGSKGGGGGGGGTTTQTVTKEEFPPEIRPYITDILERAQAQEEARQAVGYPIYPGPRIAAFTPEERAAQAGITSLVGSQIPTFDVAKGLTAASAMEDTAPAIQARMSPYMQNVVDIQKREAERGAEARRQQLAAQGAEDRKTVTAQGDQDVRKISATGSEQRSAIGAQGQVDLSKIGATGTEQRAAIGAQGEVDLSKIGASGTEQRKGIEAQGSVDIGKIGAQGAVDIDKINAAGKQERETMGEKTRQTAKDRTNQYSFANQLAAR